MVRGKLDGGTGIPPCVYTISGRDSLITQYRAYLQTVCKLQPATINRQLVSLKRYFAWAVERGDIQRDPAKVVKLVPVVRQPPRHLTDQEENALVAGCQATIRIFTQRQLELSITAASDVNQDVPFTP